MSIIRCLAVFFCLYSTLTGASYKVEPEEDRSRRTNVKKSSSSWFSRLITCCCCGSDAPTSKTTVVNVAASTKKSKERSTLELDKEKTEFVNLLIKQEDCVIKRPIVNLASLRVLILDGAVLEHVKLSGICQSSGINISNVVTVKSGKDAFDIFFESFIGGELFGLILLGGNMRDGLTQLQIIGKIRQFEVEINPIVISISADCINESEAAYERYGMDAIFVNPFNASVFKSLLKKYFRFTGVNSPNQNLLGTVHEELYDE